jgi:hypothetical protein
VPGACQAEFDELRKHNNALKWTLICYGLIMLMSVLAYCLYYSLGKQAAASKKVATTDSKKMPASDASM